MRDVSGSDVTPAAVKVSTCAPSVAGGGSRTRGGAFWGSLERPCCAPDVSETHSQFLRVWGMQESRACTMDRWRENNTLKKKKRTFPNLFPF